MRPDGAHYFPAFPYTSFTQISDADLRDLWAFLRTLPPSDRPSRAQEVSFPFNWRTLIGFWKRLYFTPGPFVAGAGRTPAQNRGAYLVNALGHCGECHTPRSWLGGPDRSRAFGGARLPEGGGAPNLTPASLKKWSDAELKDFLAFGLTPDGDVVGDIMGEVIRNTTSKLTPEDLTAVIAYLRSLPPVPEQPR
jgi:mono/diheme cytochrome c family protein